VSWDVWYMYVPIPHKLKIHFGKSGGGSTSHLGYAKCGKLILELIELLEQFRLLFCAELVDVEFGCE
jgi:hypothetical protein